MARISDGIETFICSLFDGCEKVELQRNELAQYFGCAPSQINYVLTTRFNVERGYLVHSKRGGGGYILVERIPHERASMQDYLIKQIGQSIALQPARDILQNLWQKDMITKRELGIMRVVIDKMPPGSTENQDKMRAYVLKNMIKAVLHGYCQEKMQNVELIENQWTLNGEAASRPSLNDECETDE